jgi:alkane 1-monooxygenase
MNDPASARRGENSWSFVIRSIVMSVPSAWKIEKLRLSRQKKSVLSFSNRLFQVWFLSAIFAAAFLFVGGVSALIYFFMQALVAVLLLELINYIEHYGLTRNILENGKPEPIQLWHSWDSHSRLSGYILVHLSRHADHHKYPARPFTKLEGSRQSPTMPVGYPASVLLATVPPLWYLVMHPRLDRFERSRKAKADEKLDPHPTFE